MAVKEDIVTVAYESAARERAARKKHKLKWHRGAGGGLEAAGSRGKYCVVRQRPDRRHGIHRWGVTHDGHSIGSDDSLASAKGLASHHDHVQMCAEAREASEAKKTDWKVPEGLPIDLSTYAPTPTPVSMPAPRPVVPETLVWRNETGARIATTTGGYKYVVFPHHARHGARTEYRLVVVNPSGSEYRSPHTYRTERAAMAIAAGLAAKGVREDANEASEERRGSYRSQVVRALRLMGQSDPETFVDDHHQDVERYELAGVEPNVAAAILSTSGIHRMHRDVAESSASESPTRGEWEVVVSNPPREHQGAILAMAGPGYGRHEGGKIYLYGFYDDEEARHVANSISRKYGTRYGTTVTFGPRRSMAAEDSHPGVVAEETARVKKGDTKTSDVDGGVTWTVIHVTEGGDVVISVRPHDGRQPYETTVSRIEWYSMPRHETAEERRRPHRGGVEKAEKEDCEHGCPTGECKPFTKLERDPELFRKCMDRAKEIGVLDNSRKLYDLIRHDLQSRDREVFGVVCIDFRGQLRDFVILSVGQRHRVAVDVEDILQVVILSGSDGFAVCHSHPSGNAEPSQADRQLTKMIEKAAATACPNVKMVDHIVVGVSNYYSFSDKKLHRV